MPCFVLSRGFAALGSLGVGTQVVTRAGPALVLASVVRHSDAGGVPVYNLEVEGDHTYFVGDANGGLWVHNIGACDFTEDQNALVALAKAAKRGSRPGLSGISRKEAQTLLDWADELGVGHGDGIERHSNRPLAQFPHIRIGPINHIWVFP